MHVEIPDHGELPQVGTSRFKKLTSPLELCSHDGKVMSLVAEGRMHQLLINQGCSERDGIDTITAACPPIWVKCGVKGIL